MSRIVFLLEEYSMKVLLEGLLPRFFPNLSFLVCQEIEAWYLGDGEALAEAFGNSRLRDIGAKARYRDPDAIIQPARVLEKLVPEFQKVSGARCMAEKMRRDRSGSHSFMVFMAAIERAAAALGTSASTGGNT